MHAPTTPRVTRHTWATGSTGEVPGVLIDIPGVRSRGTFVPLSDLPALIDQLTDIEDGK